MKNVSIVIPNDGSECSDKYKVEVKLQTDTGYTVLPDQYESPIVITQLEDNTAYDVRITRFCCNGQYSTPLVFTINTGELLAPDNFNLVQDGGAVDATWDAVSGATNYVLERAEDSGFTVNLVEVYSGATNSFEDNTVSATTYWYRVKAQASGYMDSDYATDTITVI